MQAALAEEQAALCSGAWDVTSGVGPLHLAAARGAAGAVATLLEAGAPVDAPDGDGVTALQVCIRNMLPCVGLCSAVELSSVADAPNGDGVAALQVRLLPSAQKRGNSSQGCKHMMQATRPRAPRAWPIKIAKNNAPFGDLFSSYSAAGKRERPERQRALRAAAARWPITLHLRCSELRSPLMQLARRHDQSDAEGVLLCAGAFDPDKHHYPGGGAAAPIDSAVDPSAPTFEPPAAATGSGRRADSARSSSGSGSAAASEGESIGHRDGVSAAAAAAAAAASWRSSSDGSAELNPAAPTFEPPAGHAATQQPAAAGGEGSEAGGEAAGEASGGDAGSAEEEQRQAQQEQGRVPDAGSAEAAAEHKVQGYLRVAVAQWRITEYERPLPSC